jgi:hypothetical protein
MVPPESTVPEVTIVSTPGPVVETVTLPPFWIVKVPMDWLVATTGLFVVLGMTAVSPAPGTAPQSQLAATAQAVEVAPVQVHVAASTGEGEASANKPRLNRRARHTMVAAGIGR